MKKDHSSSPAEPIAIVGIGCRFPGGSDDPKKYWDLLVNGRDAISKIPKDRWNAEKFYDSDSTVAGTTQAQLGGFVDNEKVESFDAGFFGIPPREAACVDPQQRMLLETAWEALEDGGQPVDPEKGGNVGVFVGVSTDDYSRIQSDWDDGTGVDMYTPTGGALSITANRISFCFNFRGPSMAVDTACSSSLVSIHLACQSLRNSECEFALAGGVNFILSPDSYLGFSRMSMLSADGRCKPFDARANGFTRGEGAGMLLLKPLSRALEEKDRIYALIRGSAVNQDGSESLGMTMPARSSQETVIKEACRAAGIQPGDISFVEAHGTGTPVGDPIEASALGSIIGKNREGNDPLYLGSVKSNIGHLESGAGIAGLTKAILALHHRAVPPSLHFETPNPEIDFEEFNLQVPTEPVPFAKGKESLFAGVNSFGFGGTNAHVVLESASHIDRPKQNPAPLSDTEILPLSARGPGGLKALAAKFREALVKGGSVNGSSWRDICHTMSVRRFHHPNYRGAVVAENREEAVACLAAVAEGELHEGWFEDELNGVSLDKKIAFVFCGQGPQWFAMGRQLIEEDPVFRAKMEECDELIRQNGDWSLIEELSKEEKSSRIQDTSIGQPAIFAIQVSLAERWKDWGIEPAAVVGHSVGEVAAAHVAGVLSLEDAIRVIFHRGRCMAKAGEGAMLAVGLSWDEATDLVSEIDGACVAASNGPSSVTLSGTPEAMEQIAEKMDRRGIFQKALRVKYAFHSSQMDPIRDELLFSLEGLEPSPAELPLYSTVSGELTDGLEFGAEYWWQNVREAVLFCQAIREMSQAGFSNYLELGPHPALTASIRETLRAEGVKGRVFASLRRKEDERATLLKAAGQLYASGQDLDWETICPGNFVALPGYAWEREHHWAESEEFRNYRLGDRRHPLIGENKGGAENAWECRLNKRVRNLMDDHRVQDRALFPAAGYVEMALEAGRQIHGDGPIDIEGIEFFKAFFLPAPEEDAKVKLIHDSDTHSFRIYSEMPGQKAWVRHCCGEIHEVPESLHQPLQQEEPFDRENSTELDVTDCYRLFESRGLQYGPRFQGITRIYRNEGEAFGVVKLPKKAGLPHDHLRINPALLDACFQVLIAAIPQNGNGAEETIFLPTRIERIRFYQDAPEEIHSHVKLTVTGSDVIVGTIHLSDRSGKTIAELEGFTCRAAGTMATDETLDWLYSSDLEACPLSEEAHTDQTNRFMPTMDEILDRIAAKAEDDTEREPWGDIYRQRKPEIDYLCQVYIRQALVDLGWEPRQGDLVSSDQLALDLSIAKERRRVLDRFLEILAKDGLVSRQAGDIWKVIDWPEIEDGNQVWRKAVESFPAYHIEYRIVRRFGQNLAECLNGKADPVQLLFNQNDNLARDFYTRGWNIRRANAMLCEAVQSLIDELPEGRKLRILELGAGTGGTTEWVLPMLPKDSVSYVFTDITAHFLSKAEERFGDYEFVDYEVFNLEQSPIEQGFKNDSFDLVIASNVIHATADLDVTLRHIREVIAPGAMVAFLELTNPPRWLDLVFGLMDGWWAMTDYRSETLTPLLQSDQWIAQLQRCGFETPQTAESVDGCCAVVLGREPDCGDSAGFTAPELKEKSWAILADESGVAGEIESTLVAAGKQVSIISWNDSLEAISKEIEQANPEGLIHCFSLDQNDRNAAESFNEIEQNLLSVIEVVRYAAGKEKEQAPAIWFITRGAQPDQKGSPVSVAQAPLLGLARTAIKEHPYLSIRSIDLPAQSAPETDAVRIIKEIAFRDNEDEVILRGEGRYGPRLTRTTVKQTRHEVRKSEGLSYGLDIAQIGVLDTMALTPRPRTQPGAGEIEIKVMSSALNFRDVMKALGIYPTEGDEKFTLGDECAGIVTQVGEGVADFKEGDRVAAIAPGCFGSHVTTLADFAMHCPDDIQMDAAATMPIVFLTAVYALEHLGDIQPGERVLIHAATGGVGLAAIQIARLAGAEIFATAGNPRKRDFLRGIGIENVYDSRSLAFHDEILEETDGEGVDLVLNSLSGEAIAKSLSLLRDYGRFLEIGKTDIYQNTRIGLRAFRKNISYHAIDLGKTMGDRIPLVGRLLKGLNDRFDRGLLQPLPQLVFSHDQVINAFRTMREARHIGKIVINFNETLVKLAVTPETKPVPVKAEGSYLITGGTSGFGLESARWLASQGAGALILMSRSGAASAEVKTTIEELEAKGCRVFAAAADVTSREEVGKVIKAIEAGNLPPLKGIIHAAMVLDDSGITEQNPERFHRTFAPKALGAWILHDLTKDFDLDFFSMYSSFNSVIGSPGQANYAAGNIFMEALAHTRRADGQNALAINWGHIGEIGFVSRNEDVSERLSSQGFLPMDPRASLALQGDLLQNGHVQTIVADIDWRHIDSFFVGTGNLPRFTHVLAENKQSEAEQDSARIRDRIRGVSSTAEQQELLQDYLQNLLARILRTSVAKLDPNRQLMELGLDSLMSVELINRLEGDLGVGVPTGQLGMKSIVNLVDTLIPLLTGKSTVESPPTPEPEEPKESVDGLWQSTLTEAKTSTSANGMTISIGSAEELSESQLMAVLRHRYDMYSKKNLINSEVDQQAVPLPDRLKEVIGKESIVPGELKIDFDEYDFLPSCYHLTVESGDQIVGYLRLICEEKGQKMSARGIYSDEIDQISHGNISAEISRLIRPGASGNGELDSQVFEIMDQMFGILDEFAEQKGIEHIFAQVHPTHGAIYESQGLFERKGSEKLCPSVNNAPAVLMHRAVLIN